MYFWTILNIKSTTDKKKLRARVLQRKKYVILVDFASQYFQDFIRDLINN